MAERTLNFKVQVTADTKDLTEKAIKSEIERAAQQALKAEIKVVRLRNQPTRG